MHIRAATPEDLDGITQLHVASWRRAYADFLPPEYLGAQVAQDLARVWARLAPEDVVLVAIEHDYIIGFVAYRAAGVDDGPLLDNLHVAPARRGEGIGTELFREGAKALRTRGETKFWLTVIEENHAARRFYARMGGVEGAPFLEDLKGNKVCVRKVSWAELPL